MEIITKLLPLIWLVYLSSCNQWMEGIGYRIGNVTGYQLVKTYNKSKLYELECV